MEATTFLGFLLLTLTAGGVLALILELLQTDRLAADHDRAVTTERAPLIRPTLVLPAYFAAPLRAADTPPPASSLDDALLAILQDHVKAEQATVTEFVHYPSIENLYRPARPSLTLN